MKSLFTLFISFLATLTFAQNPLMPNQHKYFMDPNSPAPSVAGHSHQGVLRTGTSSCDTCAFLDYSTYNEVIATSLNLNYNGSWNSSWPHQHGPPKVQVNGVPHRSHETGRSRPIFSSAAKLAVMSISFKNNTILQRLSLQDAGESALVHRHRLLKPYH